MLNKIINCIKRAVAAGQVKKTLLIKTGSTPPKEAKQNKRKLNASPNWSVDRNTFCHSSGIRLTSIATWSADVIINIGVQEFHYRLINVDHLMSRKTFAIPADFLSQGKRIFLPGTSFDADNERLLLHMANELGGKLAGREIHIKCKHPAKPDVKRQRSAWDNAPGDGLLSLLQEKPWLIPVATAAMDTQLRSFKRFRDAPFSVYNFTTQGVDWQADKVFLCALQAMNFTSAAKYRSAAPSEIIIREKKDWTAWRECHERMVLIRTATGSLLAPLFKELDERERVRYCGGLVEPPPATIPIVRCRSLLNRRGVLDTELPKGLTPLSLAEQDALRSMMANALYKINAENIYHCWREKMSMRESYRIDPYRCWQRFLMKAMMDSNFKGEAYTQAMALMEDTAEMQQAEEAARNEAIARAINLISSPESFKDKIIDRPESKEEAIQQLNEKQEAVAFWFCPEKGKDSGRMMLAFTKESLSRLLKRVPLADELMDAFLIECERSGIMDKRSRKIKLGNATMNTVTFLIENL